MSEDIKKILKMVEDGKITSDEASILIEAMRANNEIKTTSRAKSIKIYVYDKVNDKKKVDITIPLSIAKSFLKFGLKFAPKDKIQIGDQSLDSLDFDEIINSIENGAEGTLVDVDEETERVIIKVE